MLRSKTSRWIAAGLSVALLAAAGTAVAQERRRSRAMVHHRAEGLRRMKRLMDLPEEQAKIALETSEEAVKIRDAARDRGAAILVKAFAEARDADDERRSAIREKAREEIRAVREEARGALMLAGRKAAAALTPEQRGKIEAAVKARGGTLDEDRLALGLGWRLSNPRARSLLRARFAR